MLDKKIVFLYTKMAMSKNSIFLICETILNATKNKLEVCNVR